MIQRHTYRPGKPKTKQNKRRKQTESKNNTQLSIKKSFDNRIFRQMCANKTYDSNPLPPNNPSGNDRKLLCDKSTILKSPFVLNKNCGKTSMLLCDKSST